MFRLVLLVLLFLLCLVVIGWFILTRFISNSESLVLEGLLTREALVCPDTKQRSLTSAVLIDVIHTPTPYALFEIQRLDPEKQSSNFEGKQIKARAFTTKDMVTVCLSGKEQTIPILKVTSVDLL